MKIAGQNPPRVVTPIEEEEEEEMKMCCKVQRFTPRKITPLQREGLGVLR
jgi:hypothetical protein